MGQTTLPAGWREFEQLANRLYSVDKRDEVWEALENLSDVAESAIAEAGLKALVALVSSDTAVDQEAATAALRTLANSRRNRAAIAAADGIAPLVALATSGAPGGKEAVAALRNLTHDDTNRAGIAERLVGLLSSGAAEEQAGEAAWALAQLAECNATNQGAIVKAGAVEALVALALSGAAGGLEKAVQALSELAWRNDTNSAAIVEAFVAAANGDHHEQAGRAMKVFTDVGFANRAAVAEVLVRVAADEINYEDMWKEIFETIGMLPKDCQCKAYGKAVYNRCVKSGRPLQGIRPVHSKECSKEIVKGRGPPLVARAMEVFTRGGANICFAVAEALASEGDQARVERLMQILTRGNDTNRATIAAGLVALLTSRYSQKRGARAMEIFTRGKAENCVATVEADGIAALVQQVARGSAKKATFAVLRNIACDAVSWTMHFLRLFEQCYGHADVHACILAYIEPNNFTIVRALVALVRSDGDRGRVKAAEALAYLAGDAANHIVIAETGGIAALVEFVEFVKYEKYASQAVRALAILAVDAANHTAIVKAGSIPSLVKLVTWGTKFGQAQAAQTLGSLGHVAANRPAIVKAGGVRVLAELVHDLKVSGEYDHAWREAVAALKLLRDDPYDEEVSHAISEVACAWGDSNLMDE